MRTLIVATSTKPANLAQEIALGKRPRLDYVELCDRLEASYVDYDPPWIHRHDWIRSLEKDLRLDVYWAKQIARKVKEEAYDAVLSMSERVGIPLAHMLSRRIKHVSILHHPLSPIKLRCTSALRTLHRWDTTLTLSQAEASALQESSHLGPDRIRALHLAIDCKFYKPTPATQSGKNQDRILSLGVSNRDYPTLIRALRTLPHVNCQISATSAWAGPGTSSENQDFPANVRRKSYDHPSIIRDAYAQSRFIVVPLRPHLTQWSAGSASVLQPQSMGKPVIATRTPGMLDYVLDGETGILVEEGNPAALAQAIDYLWSNPQEAERMGRRAQEWVDANFSLEKWMDDITRLLEA